MYSNASRLAFSII